MRRRWRLTAHAEGLLDARFPVPRLRGPEVLEWAEAPDPHPGPGEVRVNVRASSVNPLDWKIFAGAMSGGQPWMAPATSASKRPAWSTRSARASPRWPSATTCSAGVRAPRPSTQYWTRWRTSRHRWTGQWRPRRAFPGKPEPGLRWSGYDGRRHAARRRRRRRGGRGRRADRRRPRRHGHRLGGQRNHDYLREIGATPVLYGEGWPTGSGPPPGARSTRSSTSPAEHGRGADQPGARAGPGGHIAKFAPATAAAGSPGAARTAGSCRR